LPEVATTVVAVGAILIVGLAVAVGIAVADGLAIGVAVVPSVGVTLGLVVAVAGMVEVATMVAVLPMVALGLGSLVGWMVGNMICGLIAVSGVAVKIGPPAASSTPGVPITVAFAGVFVIAAHG
jgi:hypothetical protein